MRTRCAGFPICRSEWLRCLIYTGVAGKRAIVTLSRFVILMLRR